MFDNNPYRSPTATDSISPIDRNWKHGVEATRESGGLLYRKIVVKKPVDVIVEYFARGLRDRIMVDGRTVFSRIPILWFYKTLPFEIPYSDGQFPAVVRVTTRPRSLRIKRFELEIKGIVVYREDDGQQISVADA